MKNFKFLVAIAIVLTVFNGCQKDMLSVDKKVDEGLNANLTKASLPVDTVYDGYASEIAQAVHQSLNDNQFCKSLKEEVMQQHDGDYDVIFKSFAKKMPSFNNTAIYASLRGNF